MRAGLTGRRLGGGSLGKGWFWLAHGRIVQLPAAWVLASSPSARRKVPLRRVISIRIWEGVAKRHTCTRIAAVLPAIAIGAGRPLGRAGGRGWGSEDRPVANRAPKRSCGGVFGASGDFVQLIDASRGRRPRVGTLARSAAILPSRATIRADGNFCAGRVQPVCHGAEEPIRPRARSQHTSIWGVRSSNISSSTTTGGRLARRR